MTRSLVDNQNKLLSPFTFQCGAYTTGSSVLASVATGYWGANSNTITLGAATSSYARVSLIRYPQAQKGAGTGIQLSSPIAISGRFGLNLAESTSYFRFLVGGNGATPTTSDANAFSAIGTGFEMYISSGVYYARIVYYNSSYVAGSWTAVTQPSFGQPFGYVFSLDGSGNVSLLIGNATSRSSIYPSATTSLTATGASTGTTGNTNSYIDMVLVGSSSVNSSTSTIADIPPQTIILG